MEKNTHYRIQRQKEILMVSEIFHKNHQEIYNDVLNIIIEFL